MIYVIYDPDTKFYSSITFIEDWDQDINQSAIYRSKKNADAKLKSQINKWKYYDQTWSKPNHAQEVLTIWQRAVVIPVNLVPVC